MADCQDPGNTQLHPRSRQRPGYWLLSQFMARVQPDQAEAWIPRDTTFGMRLAMVCQHMRLSGAGVARLCGYAASTWNSWEAGTTPENIAEVAQKIATVTGVDRDWLLYGVSSDMCPYLQLSMALDDESNQRNGAEWKTFPSSTRTAHLNALEDSPQQPSAPTAPSIPASVSGLVDAA